MKGNCENCAKAKTCRKDIGIIWGFCNTDYEPLEDEDEDTGNAVCYLWYDHCLLRKDGEANRICEAIEAHDFETFNKYRAKYGAEFFPETAFVFQGEDLLGLVNILAPEDFARITIAEYECG